MPDIGTLRHRLVIETPVDTPDGAGGVTRSWQALATVWAAIETVSQGERFAEDRRNGRLTHRIILRARADLSTRQRLRHGQRLFRIQHIHTPDLHRRFQSIQVEELQS